MKTNEPRPGAAPQPPARLVSVWVVVSLLLLPFVAPFLLYGAWWAWDEWDDWKLRRAFDQGDRLGAAFEIYRITKGKYPSKLSDLVDAGIVAEVERPAWGDYDEWNMERYTLFGTDQNLYPLIQLEPIEWRVLLGSEEAKERRRVAEDLVLAISHYRLKHTRPPSSLEELKRLGYLTSPSQQAVDLTSWTIEYEKQWWADHAYTLSCDDAPTSGPIEVCISGNWYVDF